MFKGCVRGDHPNPISLADVPYQVREGPRGLALRAYQRVGIEATPISENAWICHRRAYLFVPTGHLGSPRTLSRETG